MIELILFILIGCCLGIITGLIPGLHINTLAFALVIFFTGAETSLIGLIVAMAVTHSFFDFLPSVLLGAPSQGSYLSVLPGHRYLLSGNALTAVSLTLTGGLFAGITIIALMPFLSFFLPKIAWLLPTLIPFFLLIVLLTVLFSAKKKKETFMVMFLSAVLGLVVLRELSLSAGIMSIVIGLFSLSTLFLSLLKKPKLVRQKLFSKIKFSSSLKGSMLAVLGAGAVSIMPGIGPSQSAFILRKIFGRISTDCYMAVLGGINTANIILSLFVLEFLGNTRTGIAVAIKTLSFESPSLPLLFSASALIAIAFSTAILPVIGKKFIKSMHYLPYSKINLAVLTGLLFFLFIFTGMLSVLIAVIACSIGLFAVLNRVPRSSAMAFLIVPTILFYLGF